MLAGAAKRPPEDCPRTGQGVALGPRWPRSGPEESGAGASCSFRPQPLPGDQRPGKGADSWDPKGVLAPRLFPCGQRPCKGVGCPGLKGSFGPTTLPCGRRPCNATAVNHIASPSGKRRRLGVSDFGFCRDPTHEAVLQSACGAKACRRCNTPARGRSAPSVSANNPNCHFLLSAFPGCSVFTTRHLVSKEFGVFSAMPGTGEAAADTHTAIARLRSLLLRFCAHSGYLSYSLTL